MASATTTSTSSTPPPVIPLNGSLEQVPSSQKSVSDAVSPAITALSQMSLASAPSSIPNPPLFVKVDSSSDSGIPTTPAKDSADEKGATTATSSNPTGPKVIQKVELFDPKIKQGKSRSRTGSDVSVVSKGYKNKPGQGIQGGQSVSQSSSRIKFQITPQFKKDMKGTHPHFDSLIANTVQELRSGATPSVNKFRRLGPVSIGGGLSGFLNEIRGTTGGANGARAYVLDYRSPKGSPTFALLSAEQSGKAGGKKGQSADIQNAEAQIPKRTPLTDAEVDQLTASADSTSQSSGLTHPRANTADAISSAATAAVANSSGSSEEKKPGSKNQDSGKE